MPPEAQVTRHRRGLVAEEQRVPQRAEAHPRSVGGLLDELGEAHGQAASEGAITQAERREVDLDVAEELEEQRHRLFEAGEDVVEESLQHLAAVHPVAAQEERDPREPAAEGRGVEGVRRVLAHGHDLEGPELAVLADAHAQIDGAEVLLVIEHRVEPRVGLGVQHVKAVLAQAREPRGRALEGAGQGREHAVHRAEDLQPLQPARRLPARAEQRAQAEDLEVHPLDLGPVRLARDQLFEDGAPESDHLAITRRLAEHAQQVGRAGLVGAGADAHHEGARGEIGEEEITLEVRAVPGRLGEGGPAERPLECVDLAAGGEGEDQRLSQLREVDADERRGREQIGDGDLGRSLHVRRGYPDRRRATMFPEGAEAR